MVKHELTDADYQRLLEFRTGLRRFLHWSEEQAEAVGLTPAQHQLLLAVRGRPGRDGPTIGEIAESLLLRHHSAVELIDRAEAAGLVRRRPDGRDQRVVRIGLTALGSRRLRQLTKRHLEELDRLRTQLSAMWHGIA
jgi:DNA-binding MarR family transcriptional regulator